LTTGFTAVAFVAVPLTSPRNSAHSSYEVPFGKLHTPYSLPWASFTIEMFPPTCTQYTDAGLAIPEALLVGGAIVTILVVGRGVATVVAAVVVGVVVGVCVHPAVIIMTARTRTSKTVEVFIQLMFGFTGCIHQPEDYICAMVLSVPAGTNKKFMLLSVIDHPDKP
jgi:hypothetical protein